MANEVTTTEKKQTMLATAANKIADLYITDISNLHTAVGVPMTEESKRCAVNAVLSLCGDLGAAEVQLLPKEQIVQILQFVSVNQLDVFSGQVFIDKRKKKDSNGKWTTSVKAVPMGSAYEIMVARYGVNVKRVSSPHIVHEGDEFELPQFDGTKMTNLKHKMTLEGLDKKAIAVYYIIDKVDGTQDFAIATRESVANNLKSQIINTALGREDIDRGELFKKLEGMKLDEILNDEKLSSLISATYRSPATKEAMIIAKMKKNALMHYTRDLGTKQNNAFVELNSNVVDNDTDMVVSEQDASTADSKKPVEPTKVQDFDVDGDGVVEEEPKIEKSPANPVPNQEEITEVPVKKAVEKPDADMEHPDEKKEDDGMSAFDISDL